jgi:hypothetical protein
MIGTKLSAEDVGALRKQRAVEERSKRIEAGTVSDGGVFRSENPDISNDKRG